MIIADFKEEIAAGDHRHYHPEIQAILRTPGNEHLVSAGDSECGPWRQGAQFEQR